MAMMTAPSLLNSGRVILHIAMPKVLEERKNPSFCMIISILVGNCRSRSGVLCFSAK